MEGRSRSNQQPRRRGLPDEHPIRVYIYDALDAKMPTTWDGSGSASSLLSHERGRCLAFLHSNICPTTRIWPPCTGCSSVSIASTQDSSTTTKTRTGTYGTHVGHVVGVVDTTSPDWSQDGGFTKQETENPSPYRVGKFCWAGTCEPIGRSSPSLRHRIECTTRSRLVNVRDENLPERCLPIPWIGFDTGPSIWDSGIQQARQPVNPRLEFSP